MSAKEEKKMLSELRKSVKALRDMHVGKSVTKMSAEELAREKSHHETAVRAAEVKAKRMEGLAKAREARGKVTERSKPAGETKTTERSKPAPAPKKARVSDNKAKETTIGDLVSEKKKLPKKSSDSPKDE
jgi:hypothetical protein